MARKTTYHACHERCRRLRYTLIFFGITLVLVLLTVGLTQCTVKSRVAGTPEPAGTMDFSTSRLEIPAVDHPEFLIVCGEGRYTLLYDTLYRQAAWTAHVLTRSDVESGRAKRGNRFVVCQSVRSKGWPYAKESDYTRSGYDRGHLVPSADRVGSQAENDATFRMSNIAPQSPRLNRGLWNNLEAELRRMTERFDTLWVVTGSALKPGLKCIGAGKVGVPEHFYKVLLGKTGGRYHAIAFVIPNSDDLEGSFWEYAGTVDGAEALSGRDFFPNLPDPLEEYIESQCDLEKWR